MLLGSVIGFRKLSDAWDNEGGLSDGLRIESDGSVMSFVAYSGGMEFKNVKSYFTEISRLIISN